MGMPTFQTVTTFARVVRSWAEAIERADLDQARFYCDQVKAISLLLAMDPSYKSLFIHYAKECDSGDPEQAARCVHAFVNAVTEAAFVRRGRE